MNEFFVAGLVYVMHEISTAEMAFNMARFLGHGGQSLNAAGDDAEDHAVKALNLAESLFKNGAFPKCAKDVAQAKYQWSRPLLDISAAGEILHRLQIDIVGEMKDRKFLRISDDRVALVDNDCLFGMNVSTSFYSASEDIKQAGNCLSAECNTAAVFHLMRAAEVSLRAIATDRRVSFSDKPIDQQQWGTILGALEGKLKELRLANGNLWKDPRFRETQIQFYNEVIQELRGFNEAWRRHLSHADVKAFYDHDSASGVFNHVRTFMQKLSTRITEDKFTLEYWESE